MHFNWGKKSIRKNNKFSQVIVNNVVSITAKALRLSRFDVGIFSQDKNQLEQVLFIKHQQQQQRQMQPCCMYLNRNEQCVRARAQAILQNRY